MLVNTLINALKFIKPFMPKNHRRRELNGVLFTFTDDKTLRLVTTSGYKLAQVDIDITSGFEEPFISNEICKEEIDNKNGRDNQYIVPNEFIIKIIKGCSGSDLKNTPIDLLLPDPKEKKMIFNIGNNAHQICAIDGDYPDYNMAIEKALEKRDDDEDDVSTDTITTIQSASIYDLLTLACKNIAVKKYKRYSIRVENRGIKYPTLYYPDVFHPYKDAFVLSMAIR